MTRSNTPRTNTPRTNITPTSITPMPGASALHHAAADDASARPHRLAGRLVGAVRSAIALGTVAAIATLGLKALVPGHARASAPVSVEASYRVAYGSVGVGRLDTRTRIEGDRYALDGAFSSGGVARLFSRTEGTAESEGRIASDGLRPDSFALAYASGKKRRARRIDFDGGKVSAVRFDPPEDELPEDWVPVRAEQLVRVLDPAGGLLVGGGGSACSRTLRAYDGEMRLDVRLTPARGRAFKVEGFEGRAEVCRLAFEPVAGYREGKSTARKMRAVRGAEAAFVRVPGTEAHQLVSLSVPTRYGKVTARATAFAIRGGAR